MGVLYMSVYRKRDHLYASYMRKILQYFSNQFKKKNYYIKEIQRKLRDFSFPYIIE
jgi:hypothetical protein